LAEKREPPKVCPEVFDKLSVDWDGKVSACCGDYDNFMVVGDVGNGAVDLKTIWNHSKALKKYRKKLAEHDYKGMTLCQRCARGI
jgi:radical SAM protein with 4Fe4S-binding SPASM domain